MSSSIYLSIDFASWPISKKALDLKEPITSSLTLAPLCRFLSQATRCFDTGQTYWQNPASSRSQKMLNCCQINGQGPPLSPFCNNYIITEFNPEDSTSPLMQSEQRANYILDCSLPIEKSTFRHGRMSVERRAKPRSSDALPARVWGVDSDDQPFSFDCLLDNMSASGLYLRLPRRLKFSSIVSLVVRLLNGGPFDEKAAAIKGTVIRDEAGPDGHCGFGIRIIEHRFI